MHDYILANLMVQEIDREFERRQLTKYDPDGLAQYEIWDDAFAGPSLIERLKRVFSRRERSESPQVTIPPQHGAAECLPQG